MERLRKECETRPRLRSQNLTCLSAIYSHLIFKQFPSSPEIQSYELVKSTALSDRGGFGECYKGIFLGDQEVALKCLRVSGESGDSQVRLDRLIQREVYVWKKLQHPNVLPFIGLCTLDSVTYMVSPWMANGNAIAYVQCHPLAPRLRLLEQAATGLEYLHTFEPPIVHGDVRGCNILISASGDACIADFGLSYALERVSKFSYSTSWRTAGHCAWMAPELLHEDLVWRSLSTDVFSFGRVVIEITTGKRPFHYLKNVYAILQVASRGAMPKRPAADSGAKELTDQIWQLVEGCCHPKPHRRPQMNEVVTRILNARTGKFLPTAALAQLVIDNHS